jgi:SNF2 family DNA or RNA helicase
VLEAWREGADYVPLIGGGWAPLPRDWLERYGARIEALWEARAAREPGTVAALPPQLLPELAELGEELGARVPAELRALRERLLETPPQAALPAGLKAELRDYQREGVSWLARLRDAGLGAVLADDMGLGKTLQALCAVRGKTLVVCPTSVLAAWSAQIASFRPDLRTCVFHGAERELDESADVVLTTYALLRLERERLEERHWDSIVLDEAQLIKNPSSQAARAAHGLKGDFRLALTGTPVENRLDDLWSQFQFANPGLLGTRRAFQQEYGRAAARGDARSAERLRHRIRPFLLRRLKREVARELPPRTEVTLHCELSEAERSLYDSLLASSRQEVLQKLEQGASPFAALELLLRLRQACCSPALVPGGGKPASSSKIELLTQSLLESSALGHRALVFSQWSGLLDLIEPALRAAGLGFLRLDGSTPDRAAVVQGFQRQDGPPVLLISLKAGGTGLTLTAADHVYLMDPWWNPAVEDQAADRAHRIGQENPVLIQRLVARDTVEDRIEALKRRKQELARNLLEGAGQAAPLTREELLELLG